MQHTHDDSQAALELVRRGSALGEPVFVAPSRRARIFAFVLFFALLTLSVYLFLHTHQFFNQVQARMQSLGDADSVRISQYNQQVEALEEKMSVFIADSVESRLHTLEQNVAAGKVGEQEIRGIETLRNELKLLETYSAGKGGHIIDPIRLDHPRLQLAPGSQQIARNDQVLDELIQLKQLLYFSIASSGTVGLLLGGYWWRNTLRVRRLQAGYARVLLTGPPSGSDRPGT